MIPLLLGITIICFFVMRLAPGSPTDLQTQMNPKSSVEMKERLKPYMNWTSLFMSSIGRG